ncbi:threonylcarbamoyl-AMP synthase [Candidatus Uhrbacteria bacterium]|nr:threonylcarbamoyl-AMP synthase [Candidatus Uhrbacteria bacterium]
MKTLRTRDLDVAVKAAVATLRRGGVIAFPTETTYGLGCDPRDAKVVARIYRIKGRDTSKSLPLVAASVAQVRRLVDGMRMNDKQRSALRKLMSRHWPGPLTLILPVHRKVAQKAVAPRDEVAIRVSSSPFVYGLTLAFGFPVVATSANVTGQPECRSGRAVVSAFRSRRHQPDLVIDLGSLPRRKPSTIARIREDGAVDILRRGSVRPMS